MLLSTEIKKASIECHFLGLSDTTKNQYPSGNVRKCANASIMWLIFDNVSTTFLFNVALLFPCHMHALMQKNLSREGGGRGLTVFRYYFILVQSYGPAPFKTRVEFCYKNTFHTFSRSSMETNGQSRTLIYCGPTR